MKLTEDSLIDKIEVLADNQIQIRRVDRVLRDGVVVGEAYHRSTLSPGDDLAGVDARVAKIAKAIWPKPKD